MANKSPIPATKIIQEAGLTITQRGVDYDALGGERSMAHAVEIFNAIQRESRRLNEQDGWLFMLCLKLARSRQGKPKMDTYVDMAAYVGLLGECALASRIQVDDPP